MKLLFLMLGLAHASPDFVRVEEGQIAPFQGILLTEEALAEIISNNEREVKQCKIDADYDFKKFRANQQLKYDLLDVRYNSEVDMYKIMIQNRDLQIKKDKKRDVWQRWATYGAFALGVGTTIAVTYSVNQYPN
jgi:hypothetical protein